MRFVLFIGIICIIIIASLVYKCSCIGDITTYKHHIIKTLIRGCSRWSVASEQDTNPLISVLHANYATGYLWGIKDVFSDSEIKDATGIEITKYQKMITDIQDKSTKKAVKVCPQFAGDMNVYLARSAGDM